MAVRYGDLPTDPKQGVMLYCPLCHSTYSASRGDYAFFDPDKPLKCCNNPLVLVRETVHIASITPAEAEEANHGQAD